MSLVVKVQIIMYENVVAVRARTPAIASQQATRLLAAAPNIVSYFLTLLNID